MEVLQGKESIKYEAPAAPEKSPDYTECIVGYRIWDVESGYLTSSTEEFIWVPGAPTLAVCFNHNDCEESPNEKCGCGIYAHKTQGQVESFVDTPREDYAIGSVYLWGKVIEHERGWRSQYAYPKEIWCLNPEHAKALSRYGVPMRW